MDMYRLIYTWSTTGLEQDLCFRVQRSSLSLIGIWKGTNRHGFLGDDADLRSDRNHREPLHQNLLQQRTFYQSISPYFGNYCNNLLLDDVGNCISGTDETTHCTYIE
ncbi:hypothetical protein VNO78_27653 [Psophocarpus tetragonolobus]|uniref:Uncharacterized protein n=1 Tax=Psophocarpus tetragonolobus TaxID=3891 RepID=A0AAN9S1D0_PSOTE